MGENGQRTMTRELTLPRAVAQSRFLFILIVLIAGTIGAVFGITREPTFVATASMVIRPQPVDATDPSKQVPVDAKRYVADQAQVLRLAVTADSAAGIAQAKFRPTADVAAGPSTGSTTTAAPAPVPSTANTNITGADIRTHLSVRTDPDASLIELRYSASDPVVASIVVNAVVDAYQSMRRNQAETNSSSMVQQLQSAIKALDQEIATVDAKVAKLLQDSPVNQEIKRRQTLLLQPPPAVETPETLAVASANQARLQALNEMLKSEEESPPYLVLNTERAQASTRRASLQTQLDQVQLSTEHLASDIATFSPAKVPTTRQGFQPLELTIIALLLGTIPAALICYAAVSMRPRMSGSRDAEAILGAPLLAEIPDFRPEGAPLLSVRAAPMTRSAEAFHFLAASLLPILGDQSSQVLGVVSASPGEGKSVVSANLAIALSSRAVVMAVDADVDGRGLSTLFAVPPGQAGLLDVLHERSTLEDATRKVYIGPDVELRLLPLQPSHGRIRDRETLSSGLMGDVIDDSRNVADVVLVDLPPLLSTAYASSILHFVDGILVVVPFGAQLRELEQLHSRLALLGVPVVGYVVNRAPLRLRRVSSMARWPDTTTRVIDLIGEPVPETLHP